MKYCLHRYLITALLTLLIGASGCKSQPPKAKPAQFGIKSKKALGYYLKGRQQEQYRDYNRALQLYKEALTMEPEFADALLRSGICLYILTQYEAATPFLLKAAENYEEVPQSLYFYLAESEFYQNKFSEAKAHYEKFITPTPRTRKQTLEKAKRHYENAKFAEKAVQNPIQFEPISMGENINSIYDEYLPYLTADEQSIFFTARRPESTGGFNREYRDFTEDFFYSELKDGKWQPARNLGPPVNTDLNEGAASFSPDGQWVYFTACNRSGGLGDCDLYVSGLEGKKWSKPQNLGPLINSAAWESQPCISNDGNTLYFTSNRKGGVGGHDIWYSKKVNGKWTTAQNLGRPVNTEGEEFSPFLHADGKTLYFSSSKHPGMGGLDLFYSKKVEEEWTAPVNLGYPLNSAANEGNIFINASGEVGYINSNRVSGMGKSDLYYFELDPKIRPEFTTFVRGLVAEKNEKKPIEAEINFIDLESGDTIRAVHTNIATGKFLLSLPINRDYAAFVDAKGYLFASLNFSLRGLSPDKNNYYDLELLLDPITVGSKVVLNNIFYETGKYTLKQSSKTELQHLIAFLKRNPATKIEISGHTDNVGSESDNKQLSQNRAGEVRKYLIEQGLSASRIQAKGYGESDPRATNDTPEGRALNRRTEFKIIGK